MAKTNVGGSKKRLSTKRAEMDDGDGRNMPYGDDETAPATSNKLKRLLGLMIVHQVPSLPCAEDVESMHSQMDKIGARSYLEYSHPSANEQGFALQLGFV